MSIDPKKIKALTSVDTHGHAGVWSGGKFTPGPARAGRVVAPSFKARGETAKRPMSQITHYHIGGGAGEGACGDTGNVTSNPHNVTCSHCKRAMGKAGGP